MLFQSDGYFFAVPAKSTFFGNSNCTSSHPITLFQTSTLSLLFKKYNIPFPIKKKSGNSFTHGNDLLFNIFQLSLECRL